MAVRLSALFDERLKKPDDLVSGGRLSLEMISSNPDEQDSIVRKIRNFEDVVPKVDYSDFENFVFFNSALDYFNITGEKILNEYPYGGSSLDLQAYVDDLDDYQRYVVDQAWPRNSGHLRFDSSISSSYVAVDDSGVDSSGVARCAMLSVGTGSLSIEAWLDAKDPGTSDGMSFVVQKLSSGGDGYSLCVSGSELTFMVSSGSFMDETSCPLAVGTRYVACVFDRDASMISIMSGSSDDFPVVVSSSPTTIVGDLNMGSGRLYIASGTLPTKTTVPFSGSIDDVRVWNTALHLSDVSSSYNAKVYAQSGLVGSWRFNESRTTGSDYTVSDEWSIVLDHAGHRLGGRIVMPYSGLRASGSLTPFGSPDVIMSFNAPEVKSYVAEQQTSGSEYDRLNDNIITSMMPSKMFDLQTQNDMLENFLYIIARSFDIIKVKTDQFKNVLRTNYTEFNQTPDALLEDAGRFFGWDFTGNFLNASTFQYLIGSGVLQGPEGNKELDVKLYEIKNEFWRRTLNNLLHIYKTKGSRESVEALLRVYGVGRGFVRLKEYGYMSDSGIETKRISSEKSSYAIELSGSSGISSDPIVGSARSVETILRFPTKTTSDMSPTLTTGSIWSTYLHSTGAPLSSLVYRKDAVCSENGLLVLSSSLAGEISISSSFFDGSWNNVVSIINETNMSVHVRRVDDGEVTVVSSSIPVSILIPSHEFDFLLGSNALYQTEMWVKETRVWDRSLSSAEMDDHALNFQSVGTDDKDGLDDLSFQWRLAEGSETSIGGEIDVLDASGKDIAGHGSNFISSSTPYKKFLFEYEFIAPPDYGWTEDKIRIVDSSTTKKSQRFSGDRNVALEFNMVDALNEDISQIFSSLDAFNNYIGNPASRYDQTYGDIESLRRSYFKRIAGRLNFRIFADMLEFFDRSFIDMIRQLIPARAVFIGDEFVVESHMLERSKLQWPYRRATVPFEIEGSIQVYIRT